MTDSEHWEANGNVEVEKGVASLFGPREFDEDVEAFVRTALAELIANPTVTKIQVDLAETEYFPSTGLIVLIGAYKNAELSGKRLSVTRASEAVARLLKLTGQAERFGLDSS